MIANDDIGLCGINFFQAFNIEPNANKAQEYRRKNVV